MAHSWPDVLAGLVARRDLRADETAWAMREILSGEATPVQIAGFAVALRAKGETVDEVEGLVSTMYEFARPLTVPGRTVDIVGTGGDRARTVNISTMSAVVMAAAGALVVKHGNRAASSASGAADVLEALGVRLDVPVERLAALAEQVGITFCFAPVFHSSLRHAAVPRRELGIATTFNFLGPLTNPARPSAHAVGCADPSMAPVMAGVLARRGVDAWVFRGDDGLDELTTTTTSSLWLVRAADGVRTGSSSRGTAVEESVVRRLSIDPRELGFALADPQALRGGDALSNAGVFRELLDGRTGAVRDAVLLNAGAGLAVAGGAYDDPVEALAGGVDAARAAIDSGAARGLLDRWVALSAELAPAD